MTTSRRHRPARELRVLNAIAEALNSAPDAPQALGRTLALVVKLLGLRTGWVWMLDPDTQHFYRAAAQNLPSYLQVPDRMTGSPCWCIAAFREGRLTPKNIDVMTCSRLQAAVVADEADATEGLRSHASVPIYFGDRPLGIINVTAPAGRELSDGELQLLSTIAYQAGVAVERARLAEDATRAARLQERTRMARDIHDTLIQDLTAIALQIEGALPHLGSDPARAETRLRMALSTARLGLEEARRCVLDLRATPPAGRPLAAALRSAARAFTSETGVPVQVRAAEDVLLPPAVEAELFRVAQEALTNVRRHAGATRVGITLRVTETTGTARLLIKDNGVGFDTRQTRPPAPGPQGGQGIAGMKERAALLGGRLRVRGRPGAGVTVEAVIPGPSAECLGRPPLQAEVSTETPEDGIRPA